MLRCAQPTVADFGAIAPGSAQDWHTSIHPLLGTVARMQQSATIDRTLSLRCCAATKRNPEQFTRSGCDISWAFLVGRSWVSGDGGLRSAALVTSFDVRVALQPIGVLVLNMGFRLWRLAQSKPRTALGASRSSNQRWDFKGKSSFLRRPVGNRAPTAR